MQEALIEHLTRPASFQAFQICLAHQAVHLIAQREQMLRQIAAILPRDPGLPRAETACLTP